ncbi:hypothetical protein [Haloplanus aerogenes]|uniref:Uncharacterized protein n=1 Tax=Haloplanus aerogenes TaxID=660522 RepID=A0A3M0CVY6_9EURY|nr:hypothetical protein [Haloplanus aerogenes]AZH24024.1 hypothetical protein DU502_00930 [Haloplanus aerogenes]RMB13204.1 hypothetical protein ATH50_2536 [Haloplanus aerogenes]
MPSVDVGYPWVANESNDGVDSVTVSGTVVDCDVTSNDKLLDADDAHIFGSVDVAQDGLLAESVTVRSEGAKIDSRTVGGSVASERTVGVVGGRPVGGDAESELKPVKARSSEVSGDVVSSDGVKLQDAIVTGDVDETFDGTNSTVNG